MAPEPVSSTAQAPEGAAAPQADGAAPQRRWSSRAVEFALARRELSIAVVAIALYAYFLNTVTDFASTANVCRPHLVRMRTSCSRSASPIAHRISE